MLTVPQVSHIQTDDPLGVALRNMGRAARQAGHTFTIQEWANRLAARAGPRDYVGQLRELYKGIIERWRYVMEPGERVPGSASAVLGYTLGAKYNCKDPLRCDVESTAWEHKGWGDCDDVSALVAAGVIALGMTPVFRVVQWQNGAHVSVLARTPRGRVVSVDPVGHPTNEFGWAMDPPGSRVLTFDLDGRQLSGSALGAQPMGTYLAGFDSITAKRSTAPHLVALHPLSPQGPRFLAVPRRVQQAMLQGHVVNRAPAVDQYGQRYEYMGGMDMWVPLDGRRSRRRAARKKRRTKRRAVRVVRRTTRRKKIRRAVKRVRRGVARVARGIGGSKAAIFFRKMKSKLLGSKLVQGLTSKALELFGVPAAATKAVLQREADLAKRGGRSKIVELLADGKSAEAAALIAGSFKGAAKGLTQGLKAKMSAMGSHYEAQHAGSVICQQGGASIPAAYVAGFYSANHMLGVDDVMNVTTTATPGAWYQVKKGDTLLGIAQAAFGKPGRLGSAQRINAAPYNGRFWHAPKGDFNQKYFPAGQIALLPNYPGPDTQRLDEGDGGEFDGSAYPALWIPSESQPDAPPLVIDEPEIVVPDPVKPEDDEPEVVPVPDVPSDVPEITCPPQDYRHGPKWVPPFLNALTGKMAPGAWVCSPAPNDNYACKPGEGYGLKPNGTWGCFVPTATPPEPAPVVGDDCTLAPIFKDGVLVGSWAKGPAGACLLQCAPGFNVAQSGKDCVIVPKPTPEQPAPAPIPIPPPVQACPEWFRHPNASELAQGMTASSCLPVQCPPGHQWKSAAQGGPGVLGGCVPKTVVVIPIVPDEPDPFLPPTPEPEPDPYVPPYQPPTPSTGRGIPAPLIALVMAMVSGS